MTPAMTMSVPPGHRLFAKYAHAPNSLGYCGPAGAAALRAVAAGGGKHVDVPFLARGFSGAWPYQEVLAELSGLDDPLDERVVRGYWTGNDLTDAVGNVRFGAALLKRIRPQASHYWGHLTDDLLAEAAPTHGFHVFGVYPWSRLLSASQPEPLKVLDSCRIGWAQVVEVEAEHLLVRMAHLEYDGSVLTLGSAREERIPHRIDGACFLDAIAPGDHVAVHWGFVCDNLTTDEVARLERWTAWQLDAMAPRLASG